MSWSLNAEPREINRAALKKLKADGFVPAVVYGGGKPAQHLYVSRKELIKLAQTEASYRFGKLEVAGKSGIQCMIKDLQCEPHTGLPIHADFLNLTDAKKVTTFLTIQTIGVSPGVKRGGLLNIAVPKLEVLVTDVSALHKVPEVLEVDISDMEINSVLHLDALKLPAGITPARPARDNTILSIVAPSSSEDEAASTTETDAAASTAA